MSPRCLNIQRIPAIVGVPSSMLLCAVLLAEPGHAASYEPDSITLQARDLAGQTPLKGTNHTIRDDVVNQGYMNHYTIDSPFGEFTASGDTMLAVRVHETDAIAELKEMSKSEVFAQSAADASQSTVNAAKQLIEDPKETMKGIPGGVSRLFARTKDVVEDVSEQAQEASGDDAEGSTTDAAMEAGTNLAKSYFGIGSAHRKLAEQVRVDPYSTNTVLQAELARLASYAAAGSFGTKLIMPSIPGASLVGNVNKLVWGLSARDLKIRNETALAGMGVGETQAKAFMDNPYYTPTDQTRVVAGLEVLKGTDGRTIVINKAARASNRQEALLYSRFTEILAGYHKGQGTINAFTDSDRLLPLARTADSIVLAVPVDYVNWQESTAAAVDAIAGEAGGSGVELWVQGRVSETAQSNFGRLGWRVFDRAYQRLEK